MEVYFDSDYLQINYDQELDCVIMNWKPEMLSSEDYRYGLAQGLELVNKKECENWIGNLREMKMITMADEKWTNETWFPQALKTTLRHMAVVVSTDAFNKVAVNNIMGQVKVAHLTTKYFQDVEESREWLKTMVAA